MQGLPAQIGRMKDQEVKGSTSHKGLGHHEEAAKTRMSLQLLTIFTRVSPDLSSVYLILVKSGHIQTALIKLR